MIWSSHIQYSGRSLTISRPALAQPAGTSFFTGSMYNMALRGQRFSLNTDADDFTFDIHDEIHEDGNSDAADNVKDIKEREVASAPLPPKPRHGKTGFPLHKLHGHVNTSKSRPIAAEANALQWPTLSSGNRGPSDRAIVNQVGRKYGLDPESKEKQEISVENQRRIARMSSKDIEEARSEIMSTLSPEFIERLLRRANIDEDHDERNWDNLQTVEKPPETDAGSSKLLGEAVTNKTDEMTFDETHTDVVVETENLQQQYAPKTDAAQPQSQQAAPEVHFPVPPRNPEDYVRLDPDSPSFLSDLKTHYFPDLPQDPTTLGWLQDPTDEESKSSPYAPTQSRYAPSDIRFDFTGRLIAPNESRDIPQSKGLHHHGQASESAGYSIPELSILARSSLPNQRCIAYQILGRMLYRLGRGDFGPRGSELQDGLWTCVERERPVEVMMSEANRTGGHVSAKAHATEALWLWRKGGGGERGILRPGERIAQ